MEKGPRKPHTIPQSVPSKSRVEGATTSFLKEKMAFRTAQSIAVVILSSLYQVSGGSPNKESS